MNADLFLTRTEAADYLTARGLKVAKTTLARIAATSDQGPVYRVFGNRAIYRVADLNAWAEAQMGAPRRSSFETVAA